MAVSTQTFRWTEKYAVNVHALDNQHRRLFAATNELNDALSYGEGAAAADPVLQKLVDYALSHFAAEEALMKKHRFPELAKHQAGARRVRTQGDGIYRRVSSGQGGCPSEVAVIPAVLAQVTYFGHRQGLQLLPERTRSALEFCPPRLK